MLARDRCRWAQGLAAACVAMFTVCSASAQAPPVLNSVFPVGGQVATAVEVTVNGSNLESLHTLHSNVPGILCEKLESSRFRLTIPAESPPGLYDLWAVGANGMSAPRTFAIGNRTEQLEAEPNETAAEIPIPLNVVINGQIDKAGDSDHFRFVASRGQRVVIECWAERVDSRLHAVLEIFDESGRRLAVNRGYFGMDPLIDFTVPDDGAYVVRVQDLISSGSAEHNYRLDIDTGPRVAFAVPSVIERGKASRVVLYGWNLTNQVRKQSPSDHSDPADAEASSGAIGSPSHIEFDRIEVEIPASLAESSWPLHTRLQPAQAVLKGSSFPFYLAGSHAPVVIGLSDVPVVLANESSDSSSAQEIVVPCEVSGQLVAGDECDWFAFQALRGEVFYIEAIGQRMQSPVDLQVSVLQTSRQEAGVPEEAKDLHLISGLPSILPESQEIAQFSDEVRNIGEMFPTSHLDPAGRWVCPADGRYLIAIRNLTGGQRTDSRRTYRLSVRREEPDFQLIAIPHRDDPAGMNVQRGGRVILDVLAFRRRGLAGPIRVTASDLPAGIECPDVWLGPGIDRTTVVVSADRNATVAFGELKLMGFAEGLPLKSPHTVCGGTVVRSGAPRGWGRLTSRLPLAIAGDAPLRITADAHESVEHHLYGKLQAKHSPGGVVDVAVHIERRHTGPAAPVRLTGVGIPESLQNQAAMIPADKQTGYLSFYLPPGISPGRYSMVVQAETTIQSSDQKSESVVVYSNSVTIDVQPAAFLVEVDPFAVNRARRGETIQVGYSARRINGFIGKMHTELAVPGQVTDIAGLRGRGETFVGQNDKGSLQIIVNDDAPLGVQPFLRLFTVGVIEDVPTYHGSRFLSLEIVE